MLEAAAGDRNGVSRAVAPVGGQLCQGTHNAHRREIAHGEVELLPEPIDQPVRQRDLEGPELDDDVG
ncbi:MAG: hypothetical protein KDG56_20200, partial [Ottowia sp.]|nr:hypothetical protein [Ottowia sp.]